MPKVRPKLSRRQRAAIRPFSPELPLLRPPSPDVTDPEPSPEPKPDQGPDPEPRRDPEPKPGPNGDRDRASAGGGPSPGSAAAANGTGDPTPGREERPDSPASDGDDELLLSVPSPGSRAITKGDIVFVKYQKYFQPALVTRLDGKKVVTKFIYDLVKFKRAHPFKKEKRLCRLLSYEEKVRCREAAQTAHPDTAEVLLLALEALEELEVMEPVDDPEEFFKTQCDYIVRLRSAPTSPTKAAAGPPPVQSSPLVPGPPSGAAADSDEGEDDSESDVEVLSPPLSPRPAPPPLPPQLRDEQRAYAGRLLDVVLSEACGRHLRDVHAGRAPSWRRQAFRRGERRRLLTACSLGDLETCPEMAVQARREALRAVDQLKDSRLVARRLYADEVMAPEAVRFAVKALSDGPRSDRELDAELALGAPRFRP